MCITPLPVALRYFKSNIPISRTMAAETQTTMEEIHSDIREASMRMYKPNFTVFSFELE